VTCGLPPRPLAHAAKERNLAQVPASRGARYSGPSAAGEHGAADSPHYQPTRVQSYASPSGRSDDGWDAPTHTISASYAATAEATSLRRPERGVAGWVAVLVLIGIAVIGAVIDLINHSQVKGGFNISIVVGTIVAILIVRRSAMFPVVVAPPLVYVAASAVLLYTRSSGLHDRKVLLDAAANWLVYGFPAIAGATAAVLIIAGVRLISGR
jgi:hypothetical protein